MTVRGFFERDREKPPVARWWIVSQSVVTLMMVANIAIARATETFQWYTWLLVVGTVLGALAVLYEVRRARQRGRRW